MRAKRQSGFTLIELLIAFSIITILAAIAALYLVRSNSNAQARNFMDGLAQNINFARSVSMSRSQRTQILFNSTNRYSIINLDYQPSPKVLYVSPATTVTLSGILAGDNIICSSSGFCLAYNSTGAPKTIATIIATGNGITRTLTLTVLGLTRLE